MHTPRFFYSFFRSLVLSLTMVLVPLPVFAAVAGGCGDVATIGCLEGIFENAVKAVVSLSVVALFVMIIVAGYKYMFAGGDAKKLEGAKGTLTGAILGMVIIVVAYFIIQLIGVISGATDVTQFKISAP